jgi:hypothetical protein
MVESSAFQAASLTRAASSSTSACTANPYSKFGFSPVMNSILEPIRGNEIVSSE